MVIAMEFRVLGPVEVVDDHGAVLPVSTMRRRLLAVLLVHAGEAVPADRLVHLLWPGGPPPGAVASLHAHVSRLRASLRAARTGTRPELVTCPTGYLLRVETEQLDAARFERLVQRARAGPEPPVVATLLEDSLRLWRGRAYGEFAEEEFAIPEVARLDELRLGSIEHRAEALLAVGRHEELVASLQRFTAEHPLRERPHAALMLALYRCGRRADALAVFRELRERLVRELGLEPSAALQRLHADLLAQRPETDGQVAQAPPRRLAEPVTSFLGRAHEVVTVTAALRTARLLTLVGVGGVGKTRLALAVADAAAPGYPDGVRLCELAPVADAEAVADAAATALEITHRAGLTAEDSVVAALRDRRMLLMLDNCEHVVGAAGRLAHRIVVSCPGVTVLATSREPLAVNGEYRWPVEPLPLPRADGDPGPAVQLFHDRAAAIDPDFDPDADTGAVAEICRRLDGIPLAIELAAARVAVLDPPELARRLDQRFGLLTAGPRTTQRHRTLGALVGWSYDLLGNAERTVFDRLSVFAGSFTLSAAEHVCAGEELAQVEVAGLVAELADRSLVVVDRSGPGRRYRLLETLREYGANRLSERGDARATRRRFISHYLELAERAEPHLRGPLEGQWVTLLDREMDNLRAVHHYALEWPEVDAAVRLPVALPYYAHFRLRSEITIWAERALSLPGVTGHPLLAPLYGTAADGAANRGDLARARDLAEAGLRAAVEPVRALIPLGVLAAVALYEGRLEECLGCARRVLTISEPAGDQFHTAFAYLHQALASSYGGDAGAARRYADAMQRCAEAAGNPTQLAWAAYAQGETLADADPERAIAHLQEAISHAEAVRNALCAGVARVSISALRSRHGSADAALRSFREVIEHWRRLGDWTHQWTTLRNLIELLTRIHADGAAAVLHAAVTRPRTGAAAFGAGEHRLATVAATLADRLSPAALAAATRRGAALTDDEVIAFARAEIDHALRGEPRHRTGDRGIAEP